MHYYQFNIGDYASHTVQLDPIEDIAYRRMIDWCYLHEKPLPLDPVEVAREVRMRDYPAAVAYVLNKYFSLNEKGFFQKRIESEIRSYKKLSGKRKDAANKRWASKHKGLNGDASALQVQSTSNAKQEPRTINQEPLTNNQKEDKSITQKPAVPACPVEQIIQLYRDTAKRLPSVRIVPDSVKAHIRARWLQDKRFQSLDFWKGFFEYCENNKFLSGQSETRGDRKPFRASLAWVVNATNFAKIINEDYA
jgi:uncharacterized protein YdaU (DUF1376 family)